MYINVSDLQRLALYLAVILIVAYVFSAVSQEIKIRRLGGHAARRPGYSPLGLGMIFSGIKHASLDDNLKFWYNGMRKYGNKHNPWNLEVYPGGQRIIFTADPENIKAVLAAQFNDYGKGKAFNQDWKEFLGDSIFSTDGQVWHDSRQLIRPQFIKDRVSDLDTFERHSHQLISLMQGGHVVDVKDLFFRFTLDAATDFILGRAVGSLHEGQGTNGRFASNFAHAFAEIQRIQNHIVRFGPLAKYYPRAELRKHLAILNSFVQPFVSEALTLTPEELEKRTKSDEGYTFLHAIANYTRDPVVLRDQLVAVLLAGRDTTACTLSWLFYELGRNPAIVAALRKEIADVVGFSRAPTYADLKGMKFLQHTLNETLRLYPVVPFNVRFALKDTSLPRGGGPDGTQPVGLPAGTPVGYSTHLMQLTADIYPPACAATPAPEVFAPHRWDSWAPRHWTYVPFNGGPRICVGQNFALTEMGYTLVRVLQRFSRVEGHDKGARVNYETPDVQKARRGLPWERLDGVPSVVERTVESRMPMKAEIVLSPAEEVRIAFHA